MKERAGFGIRLIASLIDALFIGLVGLLTMTLFQYETMENPLMGPVETLYYLLVPVLWSGFTVGKKIVGIKIKREDGKKITLMTMLLRNIIAGLVYAFTLGIAMIISAFMVGLREDKRSIHDLIAGTYVSYK